jgi:hypothetical protein
MTKEEALKQFAQLGAVCNRQLITDKRRLTMDNIVNRFLYDIIDRPAHTSRAGGGVCRLSSSAE